jgi:8-oxo-dGTP diphosphatase
MNNKYQTETEFLQKYDPSIFARPSISVDTVIFTIQDHVLHVLTIKRNEFPFKNRWSLVGGYIDNEKDSSIEETAKRKLTEKTGVKTPYLEQFGTIGNKTRDPRGWSVTTVYFALISSTNINLQLGKGTSEIKWSKVVGRKIKDKLAFDHAEILALCVDRLRSKVLYTSLPIYLMPREFTLGELQRVYEVILGKKIDHKSFRRRMLNSEILEEAGEMRRDGKRPAELYRAKKNTRAYIFMRNIEGAAVEN